VSGGRGGLKREKGSGWEKFRGKSCRKPDSLPVCCAHTEREDKQQDTLVPARVLSVHEAYSSTDLDAFCGARGVEEEWRSEGEKTQHGFRSGR